MSQDSDASVVVVFVILLSLITIMVYEGVEVFRKEWFPKECTCEMIKNHECTQP